MLRKTLRRGGAVRQLFVLLAAVSAVAAALALLSPSAARSATGPSYTWSPTGWSNIRNYCPSTRCGLLVSVPNGTHVLMECWVDAQWAYGAYWTNRWFLVGVLGRYGVISTEVGWINASLVRNQAPVPHC
jgi:hypothetical protein